MIHTKYISQDLRILLYKLPTIMYKQATIFFKLSKMSLKKKTFYNRSINAIKNIFLFIRNIVEITK